MSDNPWEPPFAGTEAEHLVGALDRLRTTLRCKAGHLDSAECTWLRRALASTDTSGMWATK